LVVDPLTRGNTPEQIGLAPAPEEQVSVLVAHLTLGSMVSMLGLPRLRQATRGWHGGTRSCQKIQSGRRPRSAGKPMASGTIRCHPASIGRQRQPRRTS
jgi:hypothetical protein